MVMNKRIVPNPFIYSGCGRGRCSSRDLSILFLLSPPFITSDVLLTNIWANGDKRDLVCPRHTNSHTHSAWSIPFFLSANSPSSTLSSSPLCFYALWDVPLFSQAVVYGTLQALAFFAQPKGVVMVGHSAKVLSRHVVFFSKQFEKSFPVLDLVRVDVALQDADEE